MRQSVKTLGQIVLGAGLLVLTAYVFFNPLYNDSGWVYSIGFYELLFLVIGSASLYIAYKNIQAGQGI